MNIEAINKEIHEKVFGKEWHLYSCCPCGLVHTSEELSQQDYFILKGCMKLFLKIQEKEWFWEFARERMASTRLDGGESYPYYYYDLIHPDRLAPAVYDFIKGRTG